MPVYMDSMNVSKEQYGIVVICLGHFSDARLNRGLQRRSGHDLNIVDTLACPQGI